MLSLLNFFRFFRDETTPAKWRDELSVFNALPLWWADERRCGYRVCVNSKDDIDHVLTDPNLVAGA